MQTIATFRNPLADPVGTRRGPPLVRGPQFENRCSTDLFESAAEALEHRLDVAALLHRDDSHLIFLVDPDQERLLQVVPECNAHTS